MVLGHLTGHRGVGLTLCRTGAGFSHGDGRVAGGDAWNAGFCDFLRQEWTHIAAQTGQPFGLLIRYRAVVTARKLFDQGEDATSREVAFFAAVQRKFYVEGEDPKEPAFYRDICVTTGVEPGQSEKVFASAKAVTATHREFRLARQLGVRGFSSVMLQTVTGCMRFL